MCALQLPMSQVMSNTSVMDFYPGGGLGTTLLLRLRSKKNRSSYAVSSLYDHVQNKIFFTNIGCFLFRSKKEIVHFMSLEVPHERVTFMEELGRGAFGKVHKGVMKEVTNANIYSDTSGRNPNEHSKDSLQTLKDNEGRIVAVKVLLGEILSQCR